MLDTNTVSNMPYSIVNWSILLCRFYMIFHWSPMDSRNEIFKWNIFRVTGPLREESTGHRWTPSQRSVTWSFDVFLVYAWTNGWTNNRDNMRRPRADNDVTVMSHIGPLRRKVCPCHDVIRVFLSMTGMSQTNSEIMAWISNYTQTKGWDVNSYMHAHELKWSHSRFLPISRAYTYIHIQLQWLMKS